MAAKLASAGTIVAIDISDDKLGLARQLGADHTVNARDADHVSQVKDLTRGGVDYAFEFAGEIKALETAYDVVRPGGDVVIAGLAPAKSEFAFNPANLVGEEKAIRGSYMGGCVPVRDIPRFIDLYRQGRLPVDRLISDTIGLNDINEGFDKLSDGVTIRQILVP